MLEGLIGLAVGWIICKVLAGGGISDIFHVSATAPKPGESLPISSTITSTAVSFPTSVPAGLPPWPTGWKAASPPTSGMVARAKALLPIMKMNEVKYEMGDGEWLAYYKSTGAVPGKISVTVFRTRQPVSASPSTGPTVSPVQPGAVNVSNPASPTAAPAAVPSGPKPIIKRGSAGEPVAAWQRAIGVSPADGKFGSGTERATKAWQSAHGLTPDGKVGPNTWATVASA